MLPAGPLSGVPGLAAPGLMVPGLPRLLKTAAVSASLSARGTMKAWATAGPDLEKLWQAYLTAQAAAHLAHQNWKMVKGSYDEAFYWYRKYYAADQAEIAAYHAWLSARDTALGVARAPFIPGVP